MDFITKAKTYISENSSFIRADLLSGITVALALIPEAIAFAFVAGVPPLLSLQTAIMIGLIAAVFSGRPGMISSSTAAIAIVVAPLIARYGLEYLFATVVLMGILQLLMGAFKLGKFTSIIPHPVVLGFLNGLAIVIFLSQWQLFKVDQLQITDGIETIQKVWLPTTDMLIMLGFVGLSMAIIHFLPKLTKAIPSSLGAIATITFISIGLNYFDIYSLTTVADFAGVELVGKLPGFHIPAPPMTLETLRIIFPFALTGALVGLAEATLTLRVIDDMTNTRGKMNREYFAQGLANLVNGFFGGMGGDAMIGQSIVNIQAGGRGRLSAFVASSSLLIFLFVAAPLVNAIPLAALVGLMFMVVVYTFKWETLAYKGKIPMQDIIVIGAVTLTTIFVDLASAVLLGIVLSTIMFAWEKGKMLDVKIVEKKQGEKVYKINGTIFFASIINFKEIFDVANDPENVVIDLKYAKVLDSSAIEAINAITKKYQDAGKSCIITRASKDCEALLTNATSITAIKVENKYDPTEILSL